MKRGAPNFGGLAVYNFFTLHKCIAYLFTEHGVNATDLYWGTAPLLTSRIPFPRAYKLIENPSATTAPDRPDLQTIKGLLSPVIELNPPTLYSPHCS
ncbi:hypothetical protein KC363_g63 [Hortaea werneckii]|nr:hypothetical protein KC363_g63 [Hortaea werneckii]